MFAIYIKCVQELPLVTASVTAVGVVTLVTTTNGLRLLVLQLLLPPVLVQNAMRQCLYKMRILR